MPFMTNSLVLNIGFLLFGITAVAQNNVLTGSPYSLFGLGVPSNASVGKNAVLGNGGYAFATNEFINISNPASFGALGEKKFLFDVGIQAEVNGLSNSSENDSRATGSFSNLALASSITPQSSLGISLVPYSEVGYSLIGVDSNIEGSTDDFTSNISGSGTLNELRLTYGHRLFKKLSIGGYFSFLFASIEEEELVNTSSGNNLNESNLLVSEQNNYTGVRFGAGLQYEFSDRLRWGFSLSLPTSLSGKQDRTVDKTLDFVETAVETELDIVLEDFRLPYEFGTGIEFRRWTNLSLNLDASYKLWGLTDQQDNIGEFKDQWIFGAGAEYYIDQRSRKIWRRIRYRLGYNIDTGYLSINDRWIDTMSYSAGIAIPLGNRNISFLNLSYAYSNTGTTTGFLVEERLHTFNLNLSLKDFWFKRRKIN